MGENIKRNAQKIIVFILPIIVGIVCLMFGRLDINLNQVFASFKSLITGRMEVTKIVYNTIINIRLPRILLSLLAGASLSVAGASYQKLFSNPLATPDTLGVASGASFGAALAILLKMNYIGIEVLAFIFGLLAVFLTYVVSIGKDLKLKYIILSGIMISSLFTSLVSFIKYVADVEQTLPNITFWLMGSLASTTYKKLIIGVIPMIVGMVILYLYRYKIFLLSLSEYEIETLGINLKKIRIVTIICSTMITSAAVSLCGLVGFVGLVIPHLVRIIFGDNYKTLIPWSISLGAVYLTIIDTFARSLTGGEIPISILTSIIGVPFFIFLMQHFIKRQI